MTPRTTEGRALLNDFLNKPSGFGYAGITVNDLERGILAIEAEAQAPLRKALRGLVEAHRPGDFDEDGHPGWWGNFRDQPQDQQACLICGTYDEYAVPWPCWTARAARRALDEVEG
jgi:hypothetical protein